MSMNQPNILISRGSWATVPYGLIVGRSPLQQSILLHISHMNLTIQKEEQPTANEIAEMCGISLSTFHSAVSVLEQEGVIVIIRRSGSDGRNLNTYFVAMPLTAVEPEENPPEKDSRYACTRAPSSVTRSLLHKHTHNTNTLYRFCYDFYQSHIRSIEKTHKKTHPKSSHFFEGDSDRGEEPSKPLTETLFEPADEKLQAVTVEWVMENYNSAAKEAGLSRVTKVSEIRMTKIKKLIKHFTTREEWKEMFDRLAKSGHLKKEIWFHFDFVIHSPENFEKVARGWMDWKLEQNPLAPNRLPEDVDYHSQLTQQGRKNYGMREVSET